LGWDKNKELVHRGFLREVLTMCRIYFGACRFHRLRGSRVFKRKRLRLPAGLHLRPRDAGNAPGTHFDDGNTGAGHPPMSLTVLPNA
jgi:hypothetical protein